MTDEIETLAKSDSSCRRGMTLRGHWSDHLECDDQLSAVARHPQEDEIFWPESAWP